MSDHYPIELLIETDQTKHSKRETSLSDSTFSSYETSSARRVRFTLSLVKTIYLFVFYIGLELFLLNNSSCVMSSLFFILRVVMFGKANKK